MIKVDRSFYESGCTMEGKGNRIFLIGKGEKGNLTMTFIGNNNVQITGGSLNAIVDFNDIESICVTNAKPIEEGPFPAIQLR